MRVYPNTWRNATATHCRHCTRHTPRRRGAAAPWSLRACPRRTAQPGLPHRICRAPHSHSKRAPTRTRTHSKRMPMHMNTHHTHHIQPLHTGKQPSSPQQHTRRRRIHPTFAASASRVFDRSTSGSFLKLKYMISSSFSVAVHGRETWVRPAA